MSVHQPKLETNVDYVGAKKRSNAWVWYLFLLPSTLGILLFMVYPVIDSLRLSLTNSNGTLGNWVGLRNYALILSSPIFWHAVYNTFFLAFFQMIISVPLGFIIACMINSVNWWKDFFKVLFFLPYVTPIIAVAMIFLFILNPGRGSLNFFLAKLGLPTSLWLSNPATAKWGVILLGTWSGLGFIIIICLTNLQAISNEMYEAATIDGASPLKQWFYITIPNMKGTFSFFFITGWIGGLQRFNDVFLLGGAAGSPNRSIQTITSFIYERGFEGFEFGYAAAATYILFIMILIFTYFNIRLTRLKL